MTLRLRLAALSGCLVLIAAGAVHAISLDDLGIRVDCGAPGCLDAISIELAPNGAVVLSGSVLSLSSARFELSLGDLQAGPTVDAQVSSSISLTSGLPGVLDRAVTLERVVGPIAGGVRIVGVDVVPFPPLGRIVTAVPEPSAALVFAAGLGAVGLRIGRRRRTS
jgi:hypothetical protein